MPQGAELRTSDVACGPEGLARSPCGESRYVLVKALSIQRRWISVLLRRNRPVDVAGWRGRGGKDVRRPQADEKAAAGHKRSSPAAARSDNIRGTLSGQGWEVPCRKRVCCQ